MTNKNRARIAPWLAGVFIWIAAGVSMAGDEKATADPTLKSYLDCINATARLQMQEESDKISNAESVTASCQGAKEALLKARPDKMTAKIVAHIEQHLKSREKPKAVTPE